MSDVRPSLNEIAAMPSRRLWRTTIWARPLGDDGPWQWAADTGGTPQNVADCLLMVSRMWPDCEFSMTPFLAAQHARIEAREARLARSKDNQDG